MSAGKLSGTPIGVRSTSSAPAGRDLEVLEPGGAGQAVEVELVSTSPSRKPGDQSHRGCRPPAVSGRPALTRGTAEDRGDHRPGGGARRRRRRRAGWWNAPSRVLFVARPAPARPSERRAGGGDGPAAASGAARAGGGRPRATAAPGSAARWPPGPCRPAPKRVHQVLLVAAHYSVASPAATRDRGSRLASVNQPVSPGGTRWLFTCQPP